MDNFLEQMESDSSGKKVFEDLTPEQMNSVASLAQRQVELEQEIADREAATKDLKKQLYILSTETIPQKMKELGIKGFEMDTGESLIVEDKVTASISKKNEQAAHKWLVEHGHGDIIKHTVTTKFQRAEEEKAKAFVKELESKGFTYDVRQGVHAMTLKAFVKEQLEKGNDLDTELLGVFEYSQTKITRKKK